MNMRNQEKPASMREPHQLTPGPTQFDPNMGSIPIMIAYINMLEERLYVFDLELGAMRDRFGHQHAPHENLVDPETGTLWADEPMVKHLIEEVRSKNTALEVSNRELREVIASLESANLYIKGQFEGARKREDDLLIKNKMYAEENAKLRAEMSLMVSLPAGAANSVLDMYCPVGPDNPLCQSVGFVVDQHKARITSLGTRIADQIQANKAPPAPRTESRPMSIDGNKIISQAREDLTNYIEETRAPERGGD